jgi:DNA-binding NarL/FixJ family response regulator
MPESILIADDHPIFRRGLREVLAERDEYEVVAEAGDGVEALRLIREVHPRIALLDISMPQLDGLGVLAQSQRWPDPPICVMLTLHDDRAWFNRAFRLGAQGYLLKENAEAELQRCLQTVLGGQRHVGSGISWTLDDHGALHAIDPLSSLTAAERRVLRLVAEHRSSREIAELLHISPRTVDNHRAHVAAKLDLRGANALLKFALDHRQEL